MRNFMDSPKLNDLHSGCFSIFFRDFPPSLDHAAAAATL
jgi:hypothetical protein